MCLGALRGEHSLKVARRARAGQTFPPSDKNALVYDKLPVFNAIHAYFVLNDAFRFLAFVGAFGGLAACSVIQSMLCLNKFFKSP